MKPGQSTDPVSAVIQKGKTLLDVKHGIKKNFSKRGIQNKLYRHVPKKILCFGNRQVGVILENKVFYKLNLSNFLERFESFLTQKIDFEGQIFAIYNSALRLTMLMFCRKST